MSTEKKVLDFDVIQAAADALEFEARTGPRDVVRRFGPQAVRQRRLHELDSLLGAWAGGRNVLLDWLTESVDSGELVVFGRLANADVMSLRRA